MVSCQEYLETDPALIKNGPKIVVDFYRAEKLVCRAEKLVYLAARNLSHKIRLGKGWACLQPHLSMLNKQDNIYRQTWSILNAIGNDDEEDLMTQLKDDGQITDIDE